MTPYDIAAKVLLARCSSEILRRFFGIPVTAGAVLELLPQETTTLRRSDYPLLVHTEDGRRFLVVFELQSEWDPLLPLRLLEYRTRYKILHNEETLSGVLLLRPSQAAVDFYQDNEVTYRFQLIKVYELDAAAIIAEGVVCLLPLVPLMRDGLRWAEQADRLLYESELPRDDKVDMLTVLAIMSGLVSRQLSAQLFAKRRDIMVESYAYQMIKEEGLQEGLEKGLQEGLEKGLAKGLQEGLEKGLQEGLAKGLQEGLRTGLLEAIAVGLELRFGAAGLRLLPEIAAIQDVGLLRAVLTHLKVAQAPEELRTLYRPG